MGDPEGPVTYYDIMPNSYFTAANTQFYPSRKYTVRAAVYDGTTDDGSQFSTKCASATPRYGVPG